MHPRFYTLYISFLVLVSSLLLTSSCNKTFDAPPLGTDPDIPVTMTIKQLKDQYVAAGIFQRIETDNVISGIVTANDRSGNIFRQFIIQDQTGAISISVDMSTGIYANFPVGRRVFIKLKGLMLCDYSGNIQLGLDSTRSASGYLNPAGIPSDLLDKYIVRGSFNNEVIPQTVSMNDLTTNLHDPLQNVLVRINDLQFSDGDVGKTYADHAGKNSVNYTLRNCSNNTIILRNSGYASFAAQPVPAGNGVLTGVYTIFISGTGIAKQFYIRDTADVAFTGVRCGERPVVVRTIADILTNYAKGDSVIPAAIALEGALVSDTKNEASQNYRFQDATAGIQIRTATAADNPVGAQLGDTYRINVGGLKISLFTGGLQIGGVTSMVKTGTTTGTPKIATIAQIKAAGRSWESSVVEIENVTFIPGASSATGQNFTIKDATGEIITFVRTTSGIVVPDAATAVTGYASLYQAAGTTDLTSQFVLRQQGDIEGAVIKTFNAVYDFGAVTTSSGTVDPTVPPAFAGMTFGSFNAVGVSANATASGRFSFGNWPAGATNGSDTFTGTIDLGKYFEVIITPQPGTVFSLEGLTFTLQRSGTGIRQYSVRSSMDGYGANLPAFISPENVNLSVVTGNIFQVTDANTTATEGSAINLGAPYKNLTIPVTFRFYGFNAESTGTFSIDNVRFTGKVE